ncbi:MAG: 50S ribosomal protein L5 [Mycoplasmataceae bacterium]|nr:50S ribosomal protein L5 [Mycoplasmataceae bacterium]
MAFNWKKFYTEKIIKDLSEKFNFKNVHQVPVLEKIVINAGVGDATKDAKFVDSMFNELTVITGQKPVTTKSKKAIAGFKLRENQNIGVKVTLRGNKMWNFVANFVNVALPRTKDFKGFNNNSFDSFGNCTIGIKEQIIFTEIDYDQIKRIRGFDLTFVISKNSKEQSFALLQSIGVPFRK